MKVRHLMVILGTLPPDAEVLAYDWLEEMYTPVTQFQFEPAGLNEDIMVDQVLLQTKPA